MDDWSELINPTRIVIAPRDAWQSPELQLMQAATSAGDQRIPGIPWLFAAVIGYAVLVGPVNFMLLRRARAPGVGMGDRPDVVPAGGRRVLAGRAESVSRTPSSITQP